MTRQMKRFILIAGLFISSCAEMETANNTLNQKETQSPTMCTDYVLHESGLLVLSCPEKDTITANKILQKEMQLPPMCMNFVVDETLALSDNQFESSEYKQCKTIVLEKLGDMTKE